MKWDNFGLPYTDENDNRSLCLQNLALYFINIYCHKYLLDEDFRKKHPVRKRLDSETFEDYDNYITQHNNAYAAMLEKNNLEYMVDSDLHFYDKVKCAQYSGGKLQIHPVLHARIIDRNNLVPMMCALLLYNFTDILKQQDSSVLPNDINLWLHRKNIAAKYLGDLCLLLSAPFANKYNVMTQLVVAKVIHPTFISKLATKLFLKRSLDSWTSIVTFLKG